MLVESKTAGAAEAHGVSQREQVVGLFRNYIEFVDNPRCEVSRGRQSRRGEGTLSGRRGYKPGTEMGCACFFAKGQKEFLLKGGVGLRRQDDKDRWA